MVVTVTAAGARTESVSFEDLRHMGAWYDIAWEQVGTMESIANSTRVCILLLTRPWSAFHLLPPLADTVPVVMTPPYVPATNVTQAHHSVVISDARPRCLGRILVTCLLIVGDRLTEVLAAPPYVAQHFEHCHISQARQRHHARMWCTGPVGPAGFLDKPLEGVPMRCINRRAITFPSEDLISQRASLVQCPASEWDGGGTCGLRQFVCFTTAQVM